MKNRFLFLPLLLILFLCSSWFAPGELGIYLDLGNTNIIGLNRSLTITSSAPVSIYGRIDAPTYGISNYNLEVFNDIDGDGFPTVADGSSWQSISTIIGWSQTTTGLLFRSSILTTNILMPGSNYIVRVWSMSNFGTVSADTNVIYWSSPTEATASNWLSQQWFAVKIIQDIKPGKIHH